MMKRRSSQLVVSTALVLAAWLLSSTTGRMQTQQQRPPEYVNGHPVAAGEVLVRLAAETPAQVAGVNALVNADRNERVGGAGWRVVRSQTQDVARMMAQLRVRPGVAEVVPNYVLQAIATPNDPLFSSLWGLNNTSLAGADIKAVKAWDISTGSTSTVIGVVDTGIDYTHPDLAANVWSAPTSFTVTIGGRTLTCPAGSHGFNAIAYAATSGNVTGGPSCDPMDDHYHGTHVSGTVGAVGNNGVGVVGVNWTTKIMGLKFSTTPVTVGRATPPMRSSLQSRPKRSLRRRTRPTCACFRTAGAAAVSLVRSSRKFSGRVQQATCCSWPRPATRHRTTTTRRFIPPAR